MPLCPRIATALLAAAVAASAVGCAREAALAGRVIDDTVRLHAPAIAEPSPDLDAGFAPGGAAIAAQGSQRGALTTPAAITGLGQFARVASATVQVGDAVAAGDIVATFETAALDADVRAAKAARASTRAQVPVIDDALERIDSNRATLSDTRAELLSAISRLQSTRAQLVSRRAQLKSVLAMVLRAGAAPPAVPTTMPPGALPPGVPVLPDPARLRAGIAQLDAAIAQIDSGLAQARSGLGRLASAGATLTDARSQLFSARQLARIARDASAVGVKAAEWRRSTAVVRASVAGRVVSVARVGDALAAGAIVAVIRREAPARVSTWVTPEEAALLGGPGGAAEIGARVGADWLTGSVRGSVTRIGVRAEYPPTSFATREIHLTRAIPVEITLDAEAGYLPPGAPVDVTLF